MGLFEIVQAVEALDARHDVLGTALPALLHGVGVSDGAPGHGNDVRLALGQGLLNGGGLLEGAQAFTAAAK